MKSPLFDALRQAKSADSAPQEAAPADSLQQGTALIPADSADASELQLASTGVFDAADELALSDDASFAESAAVDEIDFDDPPVNANALANTTMLQPAISLTAKRADEHERLHVLARATPYLCLLLAGVAAAGYFLLQSLVGQSENADLKAWASFGQAAAAPTAPPAQPVTNRFPLISEAPDNQTASLGEAPR